MAALRLFVQVDDAPAGEVFQGHLHHADRAFDDPLPGFDDRPGLLALQHRGGDLRGIG